MSVGIGASARAAEEKNNGTLELYRRRDVIKKKEEERVAEGQSNGPTKINKYC
jgi:hypothetical protein